MENNDQITALAREYAEWVTEAEGGNKAYILAEQAIASVLLRWLSKRYCLVEKSRVEYIHKSILVQLGPKNFGYSPYNQGRIDILKFLFPDLGKEVEG